MVCKLHINKAIKKSKRDDNIIYIDMWTPLILHFKISHIYFYQAQYPKSFIQYTNPLVCVFSFK